MGHDNTTDHHFGHKWYQGRAWEPEIHSGWVCSRADHCVERDLLDSVADRIKTLEFFDSCQLFLNRVRKRR